MTIKKYKLVFWDFDGVIKDSVNAKTDAFISLFENSGTETKEFIRAHHLANGGMSRFEKIPIYLSKAGQEASPERVAALCDNFGQKVMNAVVDSAWVPGVEKLLRYNPYGQQFVVVSATPQDELETILENLKLSVCFSRVFGAPVSKADAVRTILDKTGIQPKDAIFIGDSVADLNAATCCNVSFLLRSHTQNESQFQKYQGASIRDFRNL